MSRDPASEVGTHLEFLQSTSSEQTTSSNNNSIDHIDHRRQSIMADTVTKRLHIGGITPSITTDHIRDRFRSFGTVHDVEEMGLDALGEQSGRDRS